MTDKSCFCCAKKGVSMYSGCYLFIRYTLESDDDRMYVCVKCLDVAMPIVQKVNKTVRDSHLKSGYWEPL